MWLCYLTVRSCLAYSKAVEVGAGSCGGVGARVCVLYHCLLVTACNRALIDIVCGLVLSLPERMSAQSAEPEEMECARLHTFT